MNYLLLLIVKIFEGETYTMSNNDFRGISSTSFLVLYAQYLESKKSNGILKDSKVIEIVENIDYDFSQFRSFRCD